MTWSVWYIANVSPALTEVINLLNNYHGRRMTRSHSGSRHTKVLEAYNLEQAFSLSPPQLPFAQVASAPLCASVSLSGDTCLNLPTGCGEITQPG